MGKIISACIMPHPPVMVPEIGKGREKEISATVENVVKISEAIAALKPSVIIVSSPHAPSFRNFFYVCDQPRASGSFETFGAFDLTMEFELNLDLAKAIVRLAGLDGLPAGFLSQQSAEAYGLHGQLDHGTMVPLYYISKFLPDIKLVILSTPLLGLNEHYRFGQAVADAVSASDERAVYLASCDLSHGLIPSAPAGYRSSGKAYDHKIRRLIETKDVQELLLIDEEEMEEAAECGTRSLAMMFGALEQYNYEASSIAYEGTFGVGYLSALIKISGRKQSHLAKLAREAIEVWILENKHLAIPAWVPAEYLRRRAGVFVSLKKKGHLRGCIGTISSTSKNLAEEIIKNACHASSQDPRFPPVAAEELSSLVISVDVLGDAEPVDDVGSLDAKKYGVIVSSGHRRGLLLPDLDGVDTPEQQIAIALQKAGIDPDEEYRLERFEVSRYY